MNGALFVSTERAAPPVIEDPSGLTDRINPRVEELGLTAPAFTSTIPPEEYGELRLMAHGYKISESSALQQVPESSVRQLRRDARARLLTAGRLAGVNAVATAIDIGLLPDPSRQPDVGTPPRASDDNLALFQLICRGATNSDIAERLGLASSRTAAKLSNNLLKILNARNRMQLPWRGAQAGLLKPSADEIAVPDKYANRLYLLETMLGGPIVSLPRDEIGNAKINNAAHERYEEFILDLLDAPDFAIYHPRLASYCKEKYGYRTDQWRNLISKLGSYGITELKRYPGVNAAHAIELNIAKLLAGRHLSFVTDRVLATYEQRLQGEGPEFRLDASHLGTTLSAQAEAALAPPLRTAIGVAHPIMENNSFVTQSDLIRTISTFTGQNTAELTGQAPEELIEAKELGGTIGSLDRKGWLGFHRDYDSRIQVTFSEKGRRLLELGISQAKKRLKSRQ